MNSAAAIDIAKSWLDGCSKAWDQFWFKPRLPHTLGVIRICTGAMLLYMHLVLASQLTSFLGDQAWISNDVVSRLHEGDLGKSYLWLFSYPVLLWGHHLVTIAVTAAFMVGFMTRITAPLAWFLQLMYLHRLTGALFGLDQIATYSVMYLMIAPCGACYSVDAWLRRKYSEQRSESEWLKFLLPEATPSVAANIATRLFQLHLCVIYLFGGLAKARGEAWWDGTAVWYAVGNYEYQSLDMTWMARVPWLFSALTHITVFWEVFYCALVWPKLTRPIVLLLAVAVHGGIAMFLGMITFGSMMIVANMIFIEPEWIVALGRRGAEEKDSEQAESVEGESEDDISDQDMAELDDEDFHVPDEDDLSFDNLPDYEIQSDEDLEVALPEATEELKVAIEEREAKIRLARDKIREREQTLQEREQRYRQRVERLKAREEKIRKAVQRRRAKADQQAETDG